MLRYLARRGHETVLRQFTLQCLARIRRLLDDEGALAVETLWQVVCNEGKQPADLAVPWKAALWASHYAASAVATSGELAGICALAAALSGGFDQGGRGARIRAAQALCPDLVDQELYIEERIEQVHLLRELIDPFAQAERLAG
jgi:hypothetical protein